MQVARIRRIGPGVTNSGDTPIERGELTSLLSLCGTLAGLCIGIVAFINGTHRGPATAIDDVLATCAATFLLCIYLIVFALRTQSRRRAALLTQTIELLFLAALTVMTVAGFFMVYTVW
jgi:lysylphosphatidylglycerol synthetase-like protein (DUF2156 family)